MRPVPCRVAAQSEDALFATAELGQFGTFNFLQRGQTGDCNSAAGPGRLVSRLPKYLNLIENP